MLNSSMKSRSSSPKSFVFRTYANPAPQLLSFQHLRELSVSADSKGTSSPSYSAVTTPLFLTSLESAVTKKQGGYTPPVWRNIVRRLTRPRIFLLSLGSCFLFSVPGTAGQDTRPTPVLPPVHLTSEQDHQRLLDLLHIKELRRGPDGDPKSPNAANVDETKVPPYSLPDPLRFNNGQVVKTVNDWWTKRRP